MNNIMDKNVVIGAIGTATSFSLGKYHEVAAIGVAVATIIYLAVKTYYIIKRKGE
jgi:hypothetical protein